MLFTVYDHQFSSFIFKGISAYDILACALESEPVKRCNFLNLLIFSNINEQNAKPYNFKRWEAFNQETEALGRRELWEFAQ